MARMRPERIDGLDRVTPGELKVFHFLREAARPHRDFVCWYRPLLGGPGVEPDFVLFGQHLGLLVLEVKNWILPQIVAADQHQFVLRVKDREERKINPDRQAKNYVDALLEALKAVPAFVDQPPPHCGQLKIPVGRMVVFPYISQADYLQYGFNRILPLERVLLQEDLDPAGEVMGDPSGQAFRARLARAFPFPFAGLTPKELAKLEALLWPEVRLDLPLRQGADKARFQAEVRALDDLQARVARQLGSGHRLLKGPPGSGKTLVLIHRCYVLRKYQPQPPRILLVCYIIALASYLKRLLQEKGLGIGEGGVHVHHFYELCSFILQNSLGEPVQFNVPDSSYYETIITYTLESVQQGLHRLGQFDVILVDEGQDFSNEMLKILLGLLRHGGDLVIALDAYQDLYRRQTSWRALGIQAQGRSLYLGRVYRHTAEIFAFTQCFLGMARPQEPTLPLFPEEELEHGEPPQVRRFPDMEKLEAFLVTDIRRHLDAGAFTRAEIAILYDDKVYGPEGFHYGGRELPRRLKQRLQAAGIPVKWVSEDLRAKELFDITTDRVSLVSIHSAKGLDFDLVYVVGADRIRATDETRPYLTRLLYVALTRAKYRLVIPYVEENEFIRKMARCLEV